MGRYPVRGTRFRLPPGRTAGTLPLHMERARTIPRDVRCRTVVFDCDSTLTTIEGIDELAGGHAAEVAALTDAAMRGELALEQVYGRRLEIARPTRRTVEALGRRYIDTLVPDARAVVAALLAEGVTVRIVSGGLLPAVRALAGELGLGPNDVAAVDVRFDDAGEYAGFDTASPLAGSGGKRIVLAAWRATLPGPIMLVGDGATDLEARPEVDVFVAFAGVACRENVVATADAVVYGRSLAPVLALALGRDPPRDPAAQEVYERGRIALGEAESPTSQEAD